MLKKLSISVKVFGGFLTVLALLVVIGVAGVFSLSASDDAFLDYQNIAAQTNQAGRVQANLLEARLAVKRFILDTSQQNIADVESRAAKTVQFNSELIEMTAATPKWQSIARDTQGLIAQYLDAFEYATRFQFERDKLVAEKLDPLAEQLEQKVTQIMQRAFEKDMPDLAYQAGLVQRNFLLTRLNAVQYIYHYVNEEFFRARREYRELHKNHEKLLADLQDPELKAIALEVRNLQKDYYATLNSVRDLIRARNFIVYKVLDRIGPVVAADLEDLKLEAKGLQDGLGEASGKSIKTSMFVMGAVAAGAVILGVLFAWAIGTGISRPVKMITDAMKQLADGNKALDIPGREHGHEIGEMAAAVEVFKQNMIRADELASREAEESRKQVERGELLDTLAREFDASVSSLLESVSQASSEMMSTADSMSGIASDTSQRGATVAIAAEEASVNVQTVASATEELTSSINEIMRQVEQSSEIAKRAVGQASDTDNQVRGLAVAAEKIGAVISLISDIAEQTNLLALNATIEAARAGEAGKGFAVVAAEVKDLANQTGRATEDIGSQIANIQSVTNEAVDAIKSIAGTISEINEIAASISAAVEQQSTASAEIARNIEEASNGTREVTSNIQEVTQGAEKTKNTAVEVIGVAGGVSDKSAELKSKVEEFLRNVRAA